MTILCSTLSCSNVARCSFALFLYIRTKTRVSLCPSQYHPDLNPNKEEANDVVFAKLSEAYARISADSADNRNVVGDGIGPSFTSQTDGNNSKSVTTKSSNNSSRITQASSWIGQSMSLDEAKSFYVSIFGNPSEQEGLELYPTESAGQQEQRPEGYTQQMLMHDDSMTQASSLEAPSPPRGITASSADIEIGNATTQTSRPTSDSRASNARNRSSRPSFFVLAEGFNSSLRAHDKWRERYLTFQLPTWLCCCCCCANNKFQVSFFRTWCIKSQLNATLTVVEILLTWIAILTGTLMLFTNFLR